MDTADTPADQELALDSLRLFRIIFKSVGRHFHDIEKTVGIGGASLWALAEIGENDGITVSGLAKAMSVHQSTASNLMEKLESSGLVARTRSQQDRRVVHLALTEQGRALLSKAPPPYRGILLDALMQLEPELLAELHRHLVELIGRMPHTHGSSAFEPLGKA